MKRLLKLALFLMMVCPLSSLGYSQTIEAGSDALRVRRGWVAPSDGYFLNDSAMRDTVTGWTEAKKIADVRQQALEALRDEIAAQSKETARLLAELETEIAEERKAWRMRVRRGKAQGIIYGFALGFGTGYVVHKNK